MNLYIMCGPSGAGKSTWIQNQMKENKDSVWCSRDAIRFSLLAEEDEYFSKEDEAYALWVEKIQKAIWCQVKNIYVDATHLNEKARNKILDSLNLKDYTIIPVNFLTTAEKCIANNENRTGRAHVPASVIRNMCNSFKPAAKNEKYNYQDIWYVRGDEN